jgi:hypothetical protein
MEKTENVQDKTKRELALARLQSKYPDAKYEDDEALFGQINDDYDDYDRQLSEYKEREQTFADLFTRDPRSASFFMEWRKGGDPRLELIRAYGTDIVDIINDPERQEEVAEANKDYVERVAKEKEYEEAYKANLAESMSNLEKMQQEQGMTDEQADELVQFLVGIYQDVVMGKFTPEALEMARKALHHDEDVATASHEAEVRGRNEKIEEKLRTNKKGDGLAVLDGKTRQQAPTTPRPQSFFDLAREAK